MIEKEKIFRHIFKRAFEQASEIEAIALIDPSGLIIASDSVHEETGTDTLGAISSVMMELGNRALTELKQGMLRYILIDGDRGRSMLVNIDDLVILGVVFSKSAKLKKIESIVKSCADSIRLISSWLTVDSSPHAEEGDKDEKDVMMEIDRLFSVDVPEIEEVISSVSLPMLVVSYGKEIFIIPRKDIKKIFKLKNINLLKGKLTVQESIPENADLYLIIHGEGKEKKTSLCTAIHGIVFTEKKWSF